MIGFNQDTRKFSMIGRAFKGAAIGGAIGNYQKNSAIRHMQSQLIAQGVPADVAYNRAKATLSGKSGTTTRALQGAAVGAII